MFGIEAVLEEEEFRFPKRNHLQQMCRRHSSYSHIHPSFLYQNFDFAGGKEPIGSMPGDEKPVGRMTIFGTNAWTNLLMPWRSMPLKRQRSRRRRFSMIELDGYFDISV